MPRVRHTIVQCTLSNKNHIQIHARKRRSIYTYTLTHFLFVCKKSFCDQVSRNHHKILNHIYVRKFANELVYYCYFKAERHLTRKIQSNRNKQKKEEEKEMKEKRNKKDS